jgi:hypothetical protein
MKFATQKPFMHQSDILNWFILRIDFFNSNANKVVKVNIFNQIETYFGKEYNRIYFTYETNIESIVLKSTDQMTVSEKEVHNIVFFDNECPNYISFYNFPELEVQVNYRWIAALTKKLIKKNIKLEILKYVKQNKY